MKVKHQKINIYDSLKNNAYKRHTLFQAEIDVTYNCNAKCFFCFQGNIHQDTKPNLSFKEICNLLDQLKDLGCLYVGFSGGEPFFRTDFIDILKYAKKLGFVISIVTNLQLPSKDDIVELANIGVNRITVSCHSVNPQRYCDIFRVDISRYKRAFDNIKLLVEKNCSVGIAATISLLNYNEMEEIKNYFLNKGLKEGDINFNMLIQGKNDVSKFRDNADFRKYIINHKELKNNIVEKNNCFLCSAGRISCTIGPYGEVYPCTFFNSSAGNIRDISLSEIWNNSHLLKILRSIKEKDFTNCKDCSSNKYCHICMANNLNETGEYNLPSTKYCDFRKNLIENLLEEQ